MNFVYEECVCEIIVVWVKLLILILFEVLLQMCEFECFNIVCVNVYVCLQMEDYLGCLQVWLKEMGVDCLVFMIYFGGGLILVEIVL